MLLVMLIWTVSSFPSPSPRSSSANTSDDGHKACASDTLWVALPRRLPHRSACPLHPYDVAPCRPPRPTSHSGSVYCLRGLSFFTSTDPDQPDSNPQGKPQQNQGSVQHTCEELFRFFTAAWIQG